MKTLLAECRALHAAFSLDHNPRSHIVVPSAADDAACHFKVSFFRRIDRYLNSLPWLNRLINTKLLDLEPMLDVLSRNIEHHVLSLS